MPNASDSAIARKIKNGSKLADGIWAPGGSGQITRESKKDKTAKIIVRTINLFEIFIQKNIITKFLFLSLTLSGQWDLNPRPSDPQPDALAI